MKTSEKNYAPHASSPALGVFVITLLLFAVLLGTQLYLNASLYPIDKRAWGNDFRFFYHGARLFMEGQSPYLDRYYTSPPPMAMFMGVLALLPFGPAYTIFFGLTALVCFASLALLCRSLLAGEPDRERLLATVLSVAVLILGFPFQFLLDRGNTDGLMLGLVTLGLLSLRSRGALGGSLLGMAAALKIYPILLFIPLLAMRRWRPIVAGAVTFVVLGLMTASHWSAWVHQFAERDAGFRTDENGSLANTVAYVATALISEDAPLPVKSVARVATVLFLVLLAALFYPDWKRGREEGQETIAHILLYAPLMVSFPNLVYTYELVFAVAVIPALCWIWATAQARARSAILVITIGLGLSQLHAVGLQKLWGVSFVHAFPSLGLLLMIGGAIWVKWLTVAAPQAVQPLAAAKLQQI